MWLLFGSKSKTAITKGGERLKRKCPKCGVTGDFHEARTETSVNAFLAVELFKDEAIVCVCAACSEVMPKDQTLPPTLTAAEVAKDPSVAQTRKPPRGRPPNALRQRRRRRSRRTSLR